MKVQAPEFGFLLDLQHPGMLGIAAARHKLPLCSTARTYVWVQFMLGAQVRSQRAN